MAIRDIFLPLVGEPDATAIAAIDKCVAVAGDLGARISAMAVEEDIPVRPKVMISMIWTIRRRPRPCAAYRTPWTAEGVRCCRGPLWRSQRAKALPARRLRIFQGISPNSARLKDLSLVPVKTG